MSNQFFSPEGDIENYFVDEYWLIDQYVGDTLWVWGQNNSTQLGINDGTNRSTPVTTFAGGTNWKQVDLGSSHTAAIKTDGTLWVWGGNNYGQLGTNDGIIKSTPVTTFAGGTNWKQVSCGPSHTAAIKTNGTLWVWGNNFSAQLGINNGANRSTPVTTFAGGTNWKQVEAGADYTGAIKTDGTLWLWGDNTSLNLGTNDAIRKSTPVTTFAGGTNWKQVSCGKGRPSTAAIKTDGTLWVWDSQIGGTNTTLGTNDAIPRSTPVTTFAGGTNWKQVSANGIYMMAIKTDGTLWVWGRSTSGELGTNNTSSRSTPVTTFAGGTNWKQVCAGLNNNSSAIKTDGTLWVWGGNNYGQLGTNDGIIKSTPVTTFAGGTNWKQVSASIAITSGTDPTLFVS